MNVSIGKSYVTFKSHIEQTTKSSKLENDVFELQQKEIRCNMHLTTRTNLKRLWFLVTGFEDFSKVLGPPASNSNVLPISQEIEFLGINCTASHVTVLRRTLGGFKEASRQKVKNPFSLVYRFPQRKLYIIQKTKLQIINYNKLKEQKRTINSI